MTSSDPAYKLQEILFSRNHSSALKMIVKWTEKYPTPQHQQILLEKFRAFRRIAMRDQSLWLLEAFYEISKCLEDRIFDLNNWTNEVLSLATWSWRGLIETEVERAFQVFDRLIELKILTPLHVEQITLKSPAGSPRINDAIDLLNEGTENLNETEITYSPSEGDFKEALSQHFSSSNAVQAKISGDCERPQVAAHDWRYDTDNESWSASSENAEEIDSDDLSARNIKIDACGLIRKLGKMISYGERAMLSSFHFFHHFHWAAAMCDIKWFLNDLPAICVACLFMAGKAEDTICRLDYLIELVASSHRELPPFFRGKDGRYKNLGRAPSSEDVLFFEYRILETMEFDVSVAHPSKTINQVMESAKVPPPLRDLVSGVFQTRAYTDSDLCLHENRTAIIGAAIYYMSLSQKDGAVKWSVPSNFAHVLQVPWRIMIEILAEFARTAKEVVLREEVISKALTVK
eukprot:CAMPEP_0171452048 /NCGR_PEP_ID=MMETSP0945-20130129/305_1 /TAXON_ID=109269 /ORGANISM="Vaucheria litorea, Strain CCMP2940" /LENGTH=460 /DNA_ID=CAMNT_0011976623 /DNA_START=31 /DNA_END=1413 /DNA_ORIENTATION=-